ncbi:hypothetical protein PGTUg99_021943 [Puccinia graminis f. sp. tritici]|uniref:Uncharacterized protein n=1 Tax=Puccinia graminis f. sp. tritici TaxID=56615 RepID=A0A5B0NG24_PUCGR|nr:hypothetical protein PGTUg99_021943 [Puccinia graminis f. sp. tritici]
MRPGYLYISSRRSAPADLPRAQSNGFPYAYLQESPRPRRTLGFQDGLRLRLAHRDGIDRGATHQHGYQSTEIYEVSIGGRGMTLQETMPTGTLIPMFYNCTLCSSVI